MMCPKVINKRSHLKGFTLIELLVTVAVMSVLLSVAVPSFSSLLQDNSRITNFHQFTQALKAARNEAQKRGLPVTLCARDSAKADCTTAKNADWTNGWITYVDLDGAAGIGNTDLLLTDQAAKPSNMTKIKIVGTIVNEITFGSQGTARTTNGTVAFCDNSGQKQDARVVTLSALGRIVGDNKVAHTTACS